jgi:hypothetical protein
LEQKSISYFRFPISLLSAVCLPPSAVFPTSFIKAAFFRMAEFRFPPKRFVRVKASPDRGLRVAAFDQSAAAVTRSGETGLDTPLAGCRPNREAAQPLDFLRRDDRDGTDTIGDTLKVIHGKLTG